MRWIVFGLAMEVLGLPGMAAANGRLSAIVDRYYFEMSYGKPSFAPNGPGPTYEFLEESRLPGSTIWKEHFRSILRLEFPSHSAAVDSLSSREEVAKVSWNPSHTKVLASFGEYAFILSSDFNLTKVYRNTTNSKWLSDDEIQATVETGKPSVYDTEDFAINVGNDRFRSLH